MILKVVKSKRFWLIVCIVILAILFMRHKLAYHDMSEESEPPVVAVAKAYLGDVDRHIDAIGSLQAANSVDLKAEVSSKIAQLHFQEGTKVEEGQVLIELDDGNARAELMEAEANYRRAKSEFEPLSTLASKGVAARVERDKKQAELESCAARVESCKVNLSKHKICAPFAGTVGLKNISVGQFVTPGTDLLKIVDYHYMNVDFKVIEKDIGNVYIGQDIQVYVGGDKTQIFNAKVSAISPESDLMSHSFVVRAVLEVPEVSIGEIETLKPGRFVTVKVALDKGEKGVLIPEAALEGNGDLKTVYVIKEGLAIRNIVTVGEKKGNDVEIITGINDGDIVVTRGQDGVLDGKPVTIQSDISTKELADYLKANMKNMGK